MTFTIDRGGSVIYRNESSNTIDVTVSASRRTRLDLNVPGQTSRSYDIDQHGGVISMSVPPRGTIDCNPPSRETVQVEVALAVE